MLDRTVKNCVHFVFEFLRAQTLPRIPSEILPRIQYVTSPKTALSKNALQKLNKCKYHTYSFKLFLSIIRN